MQEEKKALEDKLEAYCHSNEDGREKAVIVASEKKARSQVREGSEVMTCDVVCVLVGGGDEEKM